MTQCENHRENVMLGRRHLFLKGMAFTCGACFTRFALGQFTPISAPPAPSYRAVAPACGIDRLKNFASNTSVQRLASSGISEVDRYIPEERRVLNRLFRVEPEFAFFDDGDQPQARTLMVGDTSEVLMGVGLIATEKLRYTTGWQTSLIGILAHEWAHAFQYSTRLQEKTFLWETHADYLAGWYLGSKVAMGLTSLDISIFAKSLYTRGSTKGYFDPDDYGSPDTRIQAMKAGYVYGLSEFIPGMLPDLYSAVDDGYIFVQNLRG